MPAQHQSGSSCHARSSHRAQGILAQEHAPRGAGIAPCRQHGAKQCGSGCQQMCVSVMPRTACV